MITVKLVCIKMVKLLDCMLVTGIFIYVTASGYI